MLATDTFKPVTDLPVLDALLAAAAKAGAPSKSERLQISQERYRIDGVQCDVKVLDLSVEVAVTTLAGLAIIVAPRPTR